MKRDLSLTGLSVPMLLTSLKIAQVGNDSHVRKYPSMKIERN